MTTDEAFEAHEAAKVEYDNAASQLATYVETSISVLGFFPSGQETMRRALARFRTAQFERARTMSEWSNALMGKPATEHVAVTTYEPILAVSA